MNYDILRNGKNTTKNSLSMITHAKAEASRRFDIDVLLLFWLTFLHPMVIELRI